MTTLHPLQERLTSLFMGAVLARFAFGTGFTLTFVHGRASASQERPFDLRVDGPIRFWTSEATEAQLLEHFPVVTTEPTEPLLAAHLLRLTVCGTPVASVELAGPRLALDWADGTHLELMVDLDASGPDWFVAPEGATPRRSAWAIRSEGGSVTLAAFGVEPEEG